MNTEIKISQMPAATLPLDGSELMLVVQGLVDSKAPATAFPLTTYGYLTVNSQGALTASRRLVGGTGIALVDHGPGSTLDIVNTGLPVNTPTFVVMSADPFFPNERILTAGTGITIVDGGPAGPVTIGLTVPVTAINGGTGQIVYAVGDLLYASTTTALSRLAAVAAGSFLRSTGVGAAPVWSTTTWPNAAVKGDLLYASAANVYSNLADVAAGSYLRAGGVGADPLWSTVTLPNTAARGDLLFAGAVNVYANLADVAVGSYLRSGGVGADPLWSTVTLPNAAVKGDLVFASAANVYSNLADVAAGSYLRAGGVGADPLWSTVVVPNTATLGDIWVSSAANVIVALAGNILVNKRFLTQTGTGAVSAAPIWDVIAASDLPGSFAGFANPTGTIGLTAVNGSAATAPRSDSAAALSQGIAPTWTATHIFANATTALQLSSATPRAIYTASGQAADLKSWTEQVVGLVYSIETVTDALGAGKVGLSITRGATTTIASITIGNSTDKPPITLAGATTILAPAAGASFDFNLLQSAGTAGTFRGLNTGTGWNIAFFDTTAVVYRGFIGIGTNTVGGAAVTDFAISPGINGRVVIGTSNGGAIATSFGATGAVHINAPTSATDAFSVQAVATAYAGVFLGSTTSSQSLGLYIQAGTNASDTALRIVNSNVTLEYMKITGAGVVTFPNVGTTALAANAVLSSGTLLTSTSSRRYKTDIQDISEKTIDQVMSLRPIKFKSKADADRKDWSWYGFIAEEVAEIDPRLVQWIEKGDTLTANGVQYDRVAVLLHGVVKKLMTRIDVLESRLH